MPKNKIGLKFDGFEELINQFEAMGGDLKIATENALKASKEAVTPGIQQAINKHRKTGDTEKSLDKSMTVDWQGTTASIDIGFHVRQGGLPSIFLMYGTPRTKKDTKLYNSVYGSKVKRQVAEAQKEVFQKMIARRMGG
jgi:hypothetical protein